MDRFDEIWRNSFQQDEVKPESWNTPSPSVWNGIESELLNKKKRRFIFLLLFFGIFSLLAGAGLLYFNTFNHTSSKSEDIASGLEQIDLSIPMAEGESNISNPSSEINSPNENTEGSKYHAATEDSELENKPSHEESEKNNEGLSYEVPGENFQSKDNLLVEKSKSSTIENQSDIKSQKTTNPQLWEVDKVVKNNSNDSESALNPKSVVTPEIFLLSDLQDDLPESKEQLATREITSQSVNQLTHLTKELLLLSPAILDHSLVDWEANTTVKSVSEIKPNPSRHWHLSIFSGASIWNQRVGSQYVNDLSAFDFHFSKNNMGFAGGIELGLTLNSRWEISSGLMYESIETTSGHNGELSFSKNEEDPEDNSNKYDLNLATPFGFAATNFKLLRDGELSQETIQLLADFESRHQIKNLSIPLSFRVYLLPGEESPFNAGLKIGGNLNYLFSISNQLKNVDTHHDLITFQDDLAETDLSQNIRKFHLNTSAGAFVDYRFRPSFIARLEYTWLKGLTDVFNQEDYFTKIDRHLFSISLQATLSEQ